MMSLVREEEAAVVERAVRLAVDSVINVLFGLTGSRNQEYRRMVSDRDREIRRLEGRLTELERELKLLRRLGCACSGLEPNMGPADRPEDRPESRFEPEEEPESSTGQQDCEMSLTVGVYVAPPSPPPPSFPSSLSLEPSGSSEASGGAEPVGEPPASPCRLMVKEEPEEMEAVYIKWEMSEERGGGEEGGGGEEQQENNSSPEQLEERERRKLMENPGGLNTNEEENLRSRKKPVRMCELPEEAQRLKRAAWRAASRRYYARKVARQQANPQRPASFPPHTARHLLPAPPPTSFLERRRYMAPPRDAWRGPPPRSGRGAGLRRAEGAGPYRVQLEDEEHEGGGGGGGILCS